MFGPFLIKKKKKKKEKILKKFLIKFNCLARRTINLELCNSMETDSFYKISEDSLEEGATFEQQGLTIVITLWGAIKELLKAFQEMHHNEIKLFFQNTGSD